VVKVGFEAGRTTGYTCEVNSPAHPREIEWQFECADLGAVERWLGVRTNGGVYSVRPRAETLLEDTYADTDDWRLWRAGYSLRVRAKGPRAEATLKSLGGRSNGGTAVDREEITEPLTEPRLAALLHCAGPVAERVRMVSGPRTIARLFSVRTRRRTYELGVDGVVAAEIALDESSYSCGMGGDKHDLMRVEVEVEAGANPEDVVPFVGALRTAGKLTPAEASKYEVGLRLAGLSPVGAPNLGVTNVELAMPIGEAAYAVLRKQFAEIVRHEPGTRLGADPEELHDMRVATRRLRAALSLFRPWLAPQSEYLRVEFGWVARLLGGVRDLDVQIGNLELEPEHDDLAPLVDVLQGRRREVRERMLAGLDSRSFALLLSDFTSMLAEGPPEGSPPTATEAPKLVNRRYRRFRALADALTPESPATDYHALRLRGKRLRYALEFFASPYGSEAERAVRALQQLQDVLGEHQDAEVAIHQLHDLIESEHTLPLRTAYAMGALAERQRLGMTNTIALVPELDASLASELKSLKRTMQRTARKHRAHNG